MQNLEYFKSFETKESREFRNHKQCRQCDESREYSIENAIQPKGSRESELFREPKDLQSLGRGETPENLGSLEIFENIESSNTLAVQAL